VRRWKGDVVDELHVVAWLLVIGVTVCIHVGVGVNICIRARIVTCV